MQTISLSRGVPAPELLATSELADCAREVLERDGAALLNYGPVGGYEPLREWLAEHHGVAPGEILITNGSLQALDLVVSRYAGGTAHARRGADVRPRARDRRASRRRAERRPARRRGHRPGRARAGAPSGPRTGLPLPLADVPEPDRPNDRLERRRRLLEVASKHGLVVLEDDPYRLVRFAGEDLPSLCELASGESVLYSSSFSKIVAPGLRVGYLVLPRALGVELEERAVSTYLAPTFPTQAIAFEFLRRGLLDANVARISELLRERRDALLSALERELPDASWTRPDGGYFVWLELPQGVNARALLGDAEAAGMTFVPGDAFYAGAGGGRSAARLAFSYASPDELDQAVGRLAGAVGSGLQAAAG